MTNKEIAKMFSSLAGLMELHQDNPFKIKSYQNGYIQLRKLQTPLSEMSEKEIASIKGVGKAISSKVTEILDSGTMAKLEEFKAKTPEGVQHMLNIKGLGPKKIRQLWLDLNIESPVELLYACNENRLISLKGFGLKTQEDIRKKIEYFLKSQNKYHYASLEREATTLIDNIKAQVPDAIIQFTGAIRRKAIILSGIDLIVATAGNPMSTLHTNGLFTVESHEDNTLLCRTENDTPLKIHFSNLENFGNNLFNSTGPESFVNTLLEEAKIDAALFFDTEESLFAKAGINFIEPELRDDLLFYERAKTGPLPQLVTENLIKSVIHSHTTYSDGLHTLQEMAEHAKSLGYEFIVITDHSQSAFYANGLKPDRVFQQMEEIDQLNATLAPFKILKGIESDILYDGSLDYEDEILEKFDFIIASVHSQLKMNREKATSRVLTAIENPYTTMLGHPTGRLLLSREGYPLDHERIIRACAEHKVIIELNANPYRLDLDWSWIQVAIELGVQISINPDAHSKDGINDIRYGVCAARKGGLTPEWCFNALTLKEVEDFLLNRKKALR